MHEKMTAAAGLVGRGASSAAAARAIGVNERTVRRWREIPAFRAEVERVRADLTPTSRGVYLAALTATKTDGIDWQARLRAADALVDLEAKPPSPEDEDADLLDAEAWQVDIVAE